MYVLGASFYFFANIANYKKSKVLQYSKIEKNYTCDTTSFEAELKIEMGCKYGGFRVEEC